MTVGSFLASSEKSVFVELWEYILANYLTPKYKVYMNINIDPDPNITPAMIFFALFIGIMTACIVTIFNRRTLGRPVRLLLKNGAVGRKNAKTFDEIGMKKSFIMKFFINRLTLSKAIRCVEEDEFYGIPEEEDEQEEVEYKNIMSDENSGADESDLSPGERRRKMKREKRESTKYLSGAKMDEIGSRSKNAYYVGAASKVKYKRRIESDRFYIDKGMQYRAAIRFSSKGTNPILLLVVAVIYIVIGLLIIRFLPDFLKLADVTISSFK